MRCFLCTLAALLNSPVEVEVSNVAELSVQASDVDVSNIELYDVDGLSVEPLCNSFDMICISGENLGGSASCFMSILRKLESLIRSLTPCDLLSMVNIHDVAS